MQVARAIRRSVGVDAERLLDRRAFLTRAGALGGGALAIAGSPVLARGSAVRRRRTVPLPSPAQVREDFSQMVEFGPRLTASAPHERYIAWLEDQFEQAGCQVLDCDGYTTQRWLAHEFGLDVDGAAARLAHVLPTLAAHAARRRPGTARLRRHGAFTEHQRNRRERPDGRD